MSISLGFALVFSTVALADDGIDHVPAEFATLQDAVNRGTSPVIQVAAGTWAGAEITRPVIVRGVGATITSGPRYGGLGVGFAMDARGSGSEVEGFTFACGASKQLDVGVYSSASRFGSAADDVRVANNTFQGCVQGVTDTGRPAASCRPKALTGGEFWIVEGNTFDGIRSVADNGRPIGGIGIFLYNTQSVDVLDNDFRGKIQDRRDFTTGGVVVAGCRDCAVVGNTFAVTGATGYWASVTNFGNVQTGAAATERLYVADNDATDDAAPNVGINYRSFDSFDTEWVDNEGVTFIDHAWCGDKRIETWDSRAR